MEKIWKDVVGYEGYYKISNYGELKSLYREYVMPNGGIRVAPERILDTSKNDNGYFKAYLYKETKSHFCFIHRLVALHFIPLIVGKRQVNHKDGNKENNRSDNLEWCTPKENIKHAELIGLRDLRGSKNPMYGKFGKEHPAYGNAPLKGENSPLFGKTGELHPTYGKKHKGAKKNSKLVLDTQTGIFYECLKEAAVAKNINYNTLASRLNGRYPNTTSLIFA